MRTEYCGETGRQTGKGNASDKREAVWWQGTDLPKGTLLNNNRVADTVVIGAGMAGLLTAYFLRKAGKSVIVVEAKTIASGQTGSTTAKITSQHGLIYAKMIREIGFEKARQYAKENETAITVFEKMIQEEEIDCDFQRVPAYLYTVHESGKDALRKECAAAAELGIPSFYVEKGESFLSVQEEIPFPVKAAVGFENQAQFHPLKFLSNLATGLTVYENTKVLKVKGHTIITNRGKIQARNIVFATHYPISNVPGFYFLRQHQQRSYVLALRGAKAPHGMYYGVDENGLSVRSVSSLGNMSSCRKPETLVLLGGGGHRTGKRLCSCYGRKRHEKTEEGSTVGYSYLRKMAEVYFPKAEEVAAWSAQDCMPHDKIPFIGRYSIFRPYWYVATGFGKWGMTTSMIAAKEISNAICGIKRKEKSVFSPRRLLVRAGMKNFLKDVGESLKGLCAGVFARKEHKCPHMGCKLEWNPEEGSYDCPCHGSRFTKKGELLDNPAQIDLSEKV